MKLKILQYLYKIISEQVYCKRNDIFFSGFFRVLRLLRRKLLAMTKCKSLFLFSILSGFLIIITFSAHLSYGIDDSSDYSLGNLKIGMNGDILEDYGMPIPIEEGGYHTLYNRNENVYLQVSLDYIKEKKWQIRTIRLSYKDELFDKFRLNDQLMLTGVSLINLKTENGIALGDIEKDVIKKYGKPDYRKRYNNLKELIYMKESGERRDYMSFVIKDEKVAGIGLGVN